MEKNLIFTIVDQIPEKYLGFAEEFAKINPDFTIKYFTNDQQSQFVKKYMPEYYDIYLKLPELIQKSDFFRLCAVYVLGGIYSDIDVQCVKPLKSLLLESNAVVVVEEEISIKRFNLELSAGRYKPLNKNLVNNKSFIRYGNYFFAAPSKNEFILYCINHIAKDINNIVTSIKNNNHEYWIYNTTATDRMTACVYDWMHKHQQPLKVLNNPIQSVLDEDTLTYPLYCGEYAIHWCNGIWKRNKTR